MTVGSSRGGRAGRLLRGLKSWLRSNTIAGLRHGNLAAAVAMLHEIPARITWAARTMRPGGRETVVVLPSSCKTHDPDLGTCHMGDEWGGLANRQIANL